MYQFDLNDDYKTQMNNYITALEDNEPRIQKLDAVAQVDYLNMLSDRIARIHSLTDDYVTQVGEMPEHKALERLSDLILREELKWSHKDKMNLLPVPFLSDHQIERRQNQEVSLHQLEAFVPSDIKAK